MQIQCHDIVEEWQFSLVWVPVGFWPPNDGGLVRDSEFDDEGGAPLEGGVGEGVGLQSHHRKKEGEVHLYERCDMNEYIILNTILTP